MPPPAFAVYDACVLYPAFLRDFLVRLAILGRDAGTFRAKWTGRIHREWTRAVLRRNPSLERSRLERTRALMDAHVPGCRVRNYRRWEQRLTLPDRNDRHVLAAALACVADAIVTFNLVDFPDAALAPFGLKAVTPDSFVLTYLDAALIVAAAARHRAAMVRPPMSPNEYCDALRRAGMPATADALATAAI